MAKIESNRNLCIYFASAINWNKTKIQNRSNIYIYSFLKQKNKNSKYKILFLFFPFAFLNFTTKIILSFVCKLLVFSWPPKIKSTTFASIVADKLLGYDYSSSRKRICCRVYAWTSDWFLFLNIYFCFPNRKLNLVLTERWS